MFNKIKIPVHSPDINGDDIKSVNIYVDSTVFHFNSLLSNKELINI